MRITLLAVGTKMPTWVAAGYEEYAKRLPRDVQLQLREIPLGARGKQIPTARAIAQEKERLLAAIPKGDRVVALEVKGKAWSTEHLAEAISNWQMQGDDISLLVGGPDGLAPELSAQADVKWSLSPLTLPHPLVRILLAEQIYRAAMILHNHPYHK